MNKLIKFQRQFYKLVLILIIINISSSIKPVHLLPQIDEVINLAKTNLWKQIQPNQPVWNMPPWLGTFFISEYYFQLKALNISGDLNVKSKFDREYFKNILIVEQRPDGSWMQLVDLNKKQGSLDATIFNYWFLKDVGLDQSSQTLKKARKFILDHGGIQNSQVMTRFKLAAFGQYQWHLLPYVPLFILKIILHLLTLKAILKVYINIYQDYIAQWVYPHLIPLAYLRYNKVVFPVSRVCLSQLRISRSSHCQQLLKQKKIIKNKTQQAPFDVNNMLAEAIKLRGQKGAYGAYTVSTLLTLLIFKDYSIRYGDDNDFTIFYRQNYVESIRYVDQLYFNRRVPYQGSLDDGRYWDTILSLLALLETGQNPQKLHPTVDYLIKTAVQQNGGIPYGYQFQYAPDIDDTAVLLAVYGKMKNYYQNKNLQLYNYYQKQINRTYKWLYSNQNQDGGFPAFDKDKNDDQYKVIKYIFKWMQIDKSAEIFDPSCADITGHLLEAMGYCQLFNYPHDIDLINRAIKYLIDTKKQRMWIGRWGINYIYAAGAAIPGLARIGYNMKQQWVLDVIRKLQEIQHEDGGFGEDSESYNADKFMNGVSTVTMTAWGLLAFIEVAQIIDVNTNIQKAVQYILKNFYQHNNRFFDRSVVGTGHRGVLNLQYPIYAYTFPLIALARSKKYLNNEWNLNIRSNVNIAFKKFNPSYQKTDL